VERTIYLKMRNRLQVSPSYEVKIEDIAQVVGDSGLVEKIKKQLVYKITKRDKTHVVIDAMKIHFLWIGLDVTFCRCGSCDYLFS
jgi:stage V sporulation protein AA